MQDYHHDRARALLANATQIVTPEEVLAAVARVAAQLNERFGNPDDKAFPLVLGVMGGAVVFTGHLLPQLDFPLEFDYIHVSRYGDADRGGQIVWKVIPRQDVAGRTIVVVDDILDEGETLAHVKQRLLDMGAAHTGLEIHIPQCAFAAKVGDTGVCPKRGALGSFDGHDHRAASLPSDEMPGEAPDPRIPDQDGSAHHLDDHALGGGHVLRSGGVGGPERDHGVGAFSGDDIDHAVAQLHGECGRLLGLEHVDPGLGRHRTHPV